MVAALEREIQPLVKGWKRQRREHEGRQFEFFESRRSVLVCGGIGAQAARRAAEAVIALYQPRKIVSVGFAGALNGSPKVGSVLQAARVVDASDGSSIETGEGAGTLVTTATVAGTDQKARLAKAYGADAVDMEAAAVAKAAQARGVKFSAVKAISDESGFDMAFTEGFVVDGAFQTGRFAAHVALRPWLWPGVVQLYRNTERASEALCEWLKRYE